MTTFSLFTVTWKGGAETELTTHPNAVKTQEVISEGLDTHLQSMDATIEWVSMPANVLHSARRVMDDRKAVDRVNVRSDMKQLLRSQTRL
ncbi:hypothetical protein AVEN_166973-1 [Araneus ventricosus]|uniref:Uncharacterized protein n=1 Tax=Araneus ventricosus TaxID=182803 RepID=A0A4Y2H0B7_ARAVE|nr:hypothetical protein AVEN_166973-1 [Araneus ventricosus]